MMSGGEVQQSPANDSFFTRDTLVWWDIEGCPVPGTCNPADVVDNIKSALKCQGCRVSEYSVEFHVFGWRPIVPWSVMCNLWNSKPMEFHHVGGKGRKNVTDSIRVEMINTATDINRIPRPNYLLISGGRDFEYALEKLQSYGIHIMLAQPENILMPLVSNAKCIWLWNTLAMGGLDKRPVQTIQFGKECLDVIHRMFRILNKISHISGREHSSFTPEEGKTRVVILVGLEGLEITTTCHNYANFHKKKGCKTKIVHIDTSGGGTCESHTGSRAVKRIERYKEKNYDLIVVDAGVSRLSKKMDRVIIQKKWEEMNAIFKATKPDLVMFVVESSFEDCALEFVYYFHHQIKISFPTGFVIRMSKCRIGGDLANRIFLRETPVLFIEKGENMDKLGENLDDFEIVDAELLLGMLEWAFLIDKFTLRMVHEQYKKLDQVLRSKHSIRFKYEMGMLESMTCKEFESSNPNLILQIAHSFWSEFEGTNPNLILRIVNRVMSTYNYKGSKEKGFTRNDGTIMQHCTTNDNKVSKKQRC